MPINPSGGFGGLTKQTTKVQTPTPAMKAPVPAPKPAPVVAAKPTPAPVQAAPAKTRAQLAREEADRLEQEEMAQQSQAQVHEPEVMTAETVQAEMPAASKPKSSLSVPGSTMLAMFGGGDTGVNALAMWAEQSEQRGPASLFPVITITGGDAGGQLTVPDWVEEELSMKLPQGRKPLTLVYLTYRMEIIGWKGGYDQTANEHPKPAYSCVIPGDDETAIKTANKAAKNYQFTKSDDKAKFDVGADGSGPGHIRPCLELLGYSPDLKALLVVRTLNLFASVNSTIANLARHVDPQVQKVMPFVATVRVESQTETSKGRKWPNHFFNFTADVTKNGAVVADEFKGWLQSIEGDTELHAKLEEWRTGSDRPLTDEIRGKLTVAANM